jgi:hypothetical protein
MNSETNEMLKRAGVRSIQAVGETKPGFVAKATLAENVEVHPRPHETVCVTFDFLCPNCYKRHWAEERDSVDRLFSTIWWKLKCGGVAVRMPWAATPEREKDSLYANFDWA